MNSFSVGEAFGAGFGLVGRKPLHVLAWGIVYTVLRGLPFVLMMMFVGSELFGAYGDLITTMASGGDPQEAQAALTPVISKLQSFQGSGMLTLILASAILNTAIIRAVLAPDSGGLLGMKIGMDEVWQGLLGVCVVILLWIFMIPVFIVGAIVFAIAIAATMAGGGNESALFLIFPAFLVLFLVMLWLWLRFSLAGPASFTERNFRLFESWTLTKGQDLPLLGLALLLCLVLFVAYLVIFLAAVFSIFAVGGNEAFSPESIEAFFGQSPSVWLSQAAPWLIGFSLIGALFNGIAYTVWLAPFSSVYRQLVPAAPAPAQPAPAV